MRRGTSCPSPLRLPRPPQHPPPPFDLGPARALSCRECGASVELGPFYACGECFGPLEVAYDFGPVTRESIEAGPQQHLALPGRCCRCRRTVRDIPNLEPGCTPLVPRAQPRPASSGMRALWVKDDSANPTHSFKDRVVARGARRRPRARLHDAGLPVDGQPRQRRRGRRGARRHPLGRADPVRPRAAEDRHHRRVRRHAGRRRGQLRRRQPGRLRAGRRPRGLGVRQRQRPPLLRRGLQDPGLRGGRGRWAGGCPSRS